MVTRTVQSREIPQDISILSDRVLVSTNIREISVPTDDNGEMTTAYEFTQAEYGKDEYIAYFSERDRSDIDYIAMMTDVDLEEA